MYTVNVKGRGGAVSRKAAKPRMALIPQDLDTGKPPVPHEYT